MFEIYSKHLFTFLSVSGKYLHSDRTQHISFIENNNIKDMGFLASLMLSIVLFAVAFGPPLGHIKFNKCIFLSLNFPFNMNRLAMTLHNIAILVGLFLMW